MTDALRAVSAECQKLKRTLALRLAVGVPLAVVLLTLVVNAQQNDVPRQGLNPFLGFAQASLMLWTLLVLPMCAALTAALVAAMEHQGDNWKHLFTLPVSHASIFFGKWAAVIGLVLIGWLVLYSAVSVGSAVLWLLKPGWRGASIPAALVLMRTLQGFCAAGLLVSIHVWASLRWRGFIAGLVLGVVAVMVMLGGAARARGRDTFIKVYPWALPITAIARMQEAMPSRRFVTVEGLVGGIAVGALACWTLSRRDY
jgi:hypothetical protein